MVVGLAGAGLAMAGAGLVPAGGAAERGGQAVATESTARQPTWSGISGVADDILSEREPAWSSRGASYEGPGAAPRALTRLLDRALAILATGPATELRARIAERQQDLARREARIAELRAGMTALPLDACTGAGPDASWVSRQVACQFGETRSDQAERIAEERRQADALAAAIDGDKAAFAAALADLGIHLTPEQVDGLLRLATAAAVVEAQAVYDTLRQVNDELQRATIASDESVEVARRYYGLHAVLLEVALHLHETFVQTVRDEHLPRLAAIEEEAAAARREAVGLRAREEDPALAGQLDANIKALDLTLKAAALYRDALEEQVRGMTAAWKRVARQREVAVNTWRTVRASADMLAMMSESGRAFDALLKLDLPAPRPFDNRQLEREFARLTDRLVAGRS